MKRLKFMAAGILGLALVILTLGGCAAKPGINIVYEDNDQSAPSKNLTFFGFKYEALNVMAIEEALHGFMDQHPDISISYDGIKSPAYYDVLAKRLETGNGDDIIMVDHERVLELGAQGKLADLSDISTLDNFSPLAKSQMAANDAIYYLPTSISAFGLYCNLDLLKKHGQKVPENLSELRAVCDYFVSQGITPIVANNDISLKTVVLGKSLLPYYQMEDSSEKITAFNDQPQKLVQTLMPGLQLVAEMLNRDWVDSEEALVTAKTKDDLTIFSIGDRPFMLTGAWAVPRLKEKNPGFQFEVRPYPIMEDGSVLVINVDTRISVSADSPYMEDAKLFVEYLTQSDVMWKFVDSQDSFSPLNENRLAEDEAIQPIGPYLTNGRSVIGSDDNLNFPIWDMTHQCILGMLEGDDANKAAAHMERLLKEWNVSK